MTQRIKPLEEPLDYTYKPLAPLTVFLTVVMALFIITDFTSIVGSVEALKRLAYGIVLEDSPDGETRECILAVLYGLAFYFPICLWTFRANKNLHAIGIEGLAFSPGWAVGWFFVPVLSMFRPVQVMNEIWQASDPSVAKDKYFESERWSPLVKTWWGFWLANIVLFYLWDFFLPSGSMFDPNAINALPIAQQKSAELINLAGSIINICEITLLIFIIRTITKWQKEKSESLFVTEPLP